MSVQNIDEAGADLPQVDLQVFEEMLARAGLVKPDEVKGVIEEALVLCGPELLGTPTGLSSIALAVAASRMGNAPVLPAFGLLPSYGGLLMTRGALTGTPDSRRLSPEQLSQSELMADIFLASAMEFVAGHIHALDTGRALKAAYPTVERVALFAIDEEAVAVTCHLRWHPPYWNCRIEAVVGFGPDLDIAKARTGAITGAELDFLWFQAAAAVAGRPATATISSIPTVH